MKNLGSRVRKAVRSFWAAQGTQGEHQGGAAGDKDRGRRSRVTGGKHLDGFVDLLRDLLTEAGVPNATISVRGSGVVKLPGFYRASKEWDLLVVLDRRLLATVELKSIASSFSNNCNNRAEEALGNATDYWAAYQEGVFAPSPRPWLGYFMFMNDCEKSQSPVKLFPTHFDIDDEFNGASYIRRVELLCTKMVRSRLYDSACLILSKEDDSDQGGYSEPSRELSFSHFAMSFVTHVSTATRLLREGEES